MHASEAKRTHTCAQNEGQKASAGLIVNPTLQEVAYIRAREKFKQAQNAPQGAEKAQLWLSNLNPSGDEKANADYLVASFDYKQ